MKPRIFPYIYVRVLLLVIVSLLFISVYAITGYRSFFYDHLQEELEERIMMLEERFIALLRDASPSGIDEECIALGEKGNFRITVILPDGTVVGDSDEAPGSMENHADRPEIRAALSGGGGHNVRYSTTLEKRMLYSAMLLRDERGRYGVLRAAVSLGMVKTDLEELLFRIAIVGLFILVAAAMVAWRVSKRVTAPLDTLKSGAAEISRGLLDMPVPSLSMKELDEVGVSMNEMARQLRDRLSTISDQRRREELILSNMVDGVVSFGNRGTIMTINPSAAKFLSVEPEAAEGKHWTEVVDEPKIRSFLVRSFSEESEKSKTVLCFQKTGIFLKLRFGTLKDLQTGEVIGALLLIHDVTETKRLEYMRRDFVSSVSHELKTPITTVKGFVETLLEDEEEVNENTRSFLEIIDRHTDRLASLVSDLLSLSKIEYQSEQGDIPLEEGDIREPIYSAVELSREKAAERNIRLVSEIPEGERYTALMSRELIERAVGNLIDNAVMYSGEGTTVSVGVVADAADGVQRGEENRGRGRLRIYVRDEGPGIEEKHLSRIFERFYRVDKARSRDLGGTGLGLSIVKHIAIAHGGNVSVESRPEKGSVFVVTLP